MIGQNRLTIRIIAGVGTGPPLPRIVAEFHRSLARMPRTMQQQINGILIWLLRVGGGSNANWHFSNF